MIGNIFKAYDVRAIYPDPLNEEAAWKVGYATAQFLQSQAGSTTDANAGQGAAGQDDPSPNAGKIVVSRDMRPSSKDLAHALSRGILAAGMGVIDIGRVDTSFQYFAVNYLGAAGGIQTTASHNPIEYNGFKISGREARPIGAETGLKEIEQLAQAVTATDQPARGTRELMDLWDAYRKHVLGFLSPLKRKIKIVVDASNAMAGEMVPQIFSKVENLEIIPLNFKITGKFVHEPNPLIAENMIPTQEGVVEHKADLGVCFDGDADRCIVTDELGNILGCDHLTALLAGHFVTLARQADADRKPVIAYDLRSSKVVEETILALDAQPLRSRVGHVFMKKVLRENDGVFGGELSGHFYYRDNFYADSGAITLAVVLTILSQADKPMSELIAPFDKYPQSGEINYSVPDKQAVMETLRKTYEPLGAKIDDLDGVTIDAWDVKSEISNPGSQISIDGGWWFNVRPSNTEPLLRLNAEAKDQATLDRLLKDLESHLGPSPRV